MTTDSPPTPLPPTPLVWRLGLAAGVVLLAAAACMGQDLLGPRGQALCGVVCFLGTVAVFSTNLRAVRWRTLASGIALQLFLVLFILKFRLYRLEWLGIPDGYRPGYEFFAAIGRAVEQFLAFTQKGAEFVFGALADPEAMGKVFGAKRGFVFAFSALPTIIFVSSFFSVLYYFGVLQLIVRGLARVMMGLMGTSGAETLSAAANVFMGQTEAPLIIKPYVPRMTQSELLAVMVGGMATISGGVMAVYIQLGADPVAILATSVMAAPCSLYLSKLLLPELDQPETLGTVRTEVERTHRNAIDAASAGASDGLQLALNVAAMLIAFLAFIAMLDFLLGKVDLSLQKVFAALFSPVAVLMGASGNDVPILADLLGTKLVANEFVAYVHLTDPDKYRHALSPRGYILATYALTGFANFASIGIQIGGIGGLAPTRRSDLARLGLRALLAGFLATLINAALAGLLMGEEAPSSLSH